VTLIDKDHPDASLLLNKPTNRVAHAGGERIKAGSDDEAVLKKWIGTLTKLSGVELAGALKYREEEASGRGHKLQRVELRRLTHSQYNHTCSRLARRSDVSRRISFLRRISSTDSEPIAVAESFSAADRGL
jgi:hypothetical protein